MKSSRLISLFCCIVALAAAPLTLPQPYSNDFEKAEIGKVPEELMVLDGTFAVQQIEGNKCLELAADPIGAFGALFGPDGVAAMEVKARIWAAGTGKRLPEFGIGADDAGGYKLFIVPTLHVVQLRKGDDVIASAPFEWKSGQWTWLELRVRPGDKKMWVIEGKAWDAGQKEPDGWTISGKDTEAPSAGKASIWGNDYSEQPIRFDDLSVRPLDGAQK